MKASDLKPGFRYAYSKATNRALAESLDTCDIAVLKGVYCVRVICFEDLAEIEGDDWIQCAPQVPLSELRRYKPVHISGSMVVMRQDCNGSYLDYDEVAAVSPVSDERVRDTSDSLKDHKRMSTAAVAKVERQQEEIKNLRSEVKHWRDNHNHQVGLKQKAEQRYKEARAELSTLRAQLEGQRELGEKLTAEQIKGMRNEWVIIDKKGSWEVTRAYLINGRYLEGESTSRLNPNYRYYRWTPPTLPSEPEPEVPAPETPQVLWSVRSFDKLFGWHTRWYVDETDADDYMNTLDESDRATKKPFSVTPLSEEPTDA